MFRTRFGFRVPFQYTFQWTCARSTLLLLSANTRNSRLDSRVVNLILCGVASDDLRGWSGVAGDNPHRAGLRRYLLPPFVLFLEHGLAREVAEGKEHSRTSSNRKHNDFHRHTSAFVLRVWWGERFRSRGQRGKGREGG